MTSLDIQASWRHRNAMLKRPGSSATGVSLVPPETSEGSERGEKTSLILAQVPPSPPLRLTPGGPGQKGPIQPPGARGTCWIGPFCPGPPGVRRRRRGWGTYARISDVFSPRSDPSDVSGETRDTPVAELPGRFNIAFLWRQEGLYIEWRHGASGSQNSFRVVMP